MHNFEYYNPTRILFGDNSLEQLPNRIPENAKVMLVFGSNSAKKHGTIGRIKALLPNHELFEFQGIEPNPRLETLIQAAEFANANQVDFLLAVGGGSVMDGTKFIALAMHWKQDPADMLHHGYRGVPATQATAFGCIVTLPATGSEMNMGGVISYANHKHLFMCPLTYPAFSILDPALTKTVPKEQIANGVVDAFMHAAEQYMTYPVDAKVQDGFAETLMRTLIADGPKTYSDTDNLAARKNFMWAATSACSGICGSGVPQDWATHQIGHELTTLYGIAHGRTLAIVYPHLLRERRIQKREKLIQYAERVWNINEGDEELKITQAIDKTEQFFNSLDIDTRLSRYGIDETGIAKILANLEAHGIGALSERGDLGLDVIERILQAGK